ncbi:MAG TPA: Hsp20 family protein [Aliidongia sp.]|nr:Hsp20 family protein [Aliidongia sp.]
MLSIIDHDPAPWFSTSMARSFSASARPALIGINRMAQARRQSSALDRDWRPSWICSKQSIIVGPSASSISGNTLTIKGEKKEEREEKDKNYYLSERSYGSFQRAFSIRPRRARLQGGRSGRRRLAARCLRRLRALHHRLGDAVRGAA